MWRKFLKCKIITKVYNLSENDNLKILLSLLFIKYILMDELSDEIVSLSISSRLNFYIILVFYNYIIKFLLKYHLRTNFINTFHIRLVRDVPRRYKICDTSNKAEKYMLA